MKNWRTTLAGVALAAVVAAGDFVKSDGFTWQGLGLAVGLAVLGWLSKDRNVTGGTIPQTNEAERRT